MRVLASILCSLIVLTTCDAFVQRLIRKRESCTIVKYPNVMFKFGNINGEGKYFTTRTFSECAQKCLDTAGGACKAVNYFENQQACALLRDGIYDKDKVSPSSYTRQDGVTHGYIICGPDQPQPDKPEEIPPPSGPVGCGRQADAFKPNVPKSRIIGGTEAKAHSWPWLVTFNLDLGDGYGSLCGGSLLRVKDKVEESDIVLTAAHCVTIEETMATKPVLDDVKRMTVIAGNHRQDTREKYEQRRQVVAVRFHSGFKFTKTDGANNDIAMLKLEKPIKFSDTARPICLPTSSSDSPVGKVCIAAGWGRNNSRNEKDMPVALQQIMSPAHDDATCAKGWGKTYISNQMVCSGNLQATGGTCQGDSGGTLACQQKDGSWTVYGATSFGVSAAVYKLVRHRYSLA
jgi:hypothetical protein